MKLIIAVPATLALVYRAYSKNSLTPAGLIAATITAVCHAWHPWNLPFVLLCVFFLAGTRATHVKEDVKSKLTLKSKGSPGGEGPRTHVQVLANSIVASLLCLLHAYQLRARADAIVHQREIPSGTLCFSWGRGDVLVIGIIANYAAVAADTFSSELGILARSTPRLITSPTLRKVPRGTNGGVTIEGLGAGLLGSVIIVTASMLFLPLCNDTTAGKVAGGAAWTHSQRQILMSFLALWGALGSLLDSFLGGLFQRSVKDSRSGKIVEGEGGVRVLVSPAAPYQSKRAEVHAAVMSGEGKDAVAVAPESAVDEKADFTKTPENFSSRRRTSVSEGEPARVVESGLDLLDNNDVNFLMAFTMSLGAMLVACWYWDQSFIDILRM